MNTFLMISVLVLWGVILFLGFLLLGALQSLERIRWRMDQMEAITPRRIGRDGLKLGTKAPDFTLPGPGGEDVALHDFAGRKVLLVFTQSGCGPCQAIVPELNRVHDRGEHRVVVVNNGGPETTQRWASEADARIPVLSQEQFSLSKKYQAYATPFAFLIDEVGIITSKGIVGSRQHLGYVLTGAGGRGKRDHEETAPDGAGQGETESTISSKEMTHA